MVMGNKSLYLFHLKKTGSFTHRKKTPGDFFLYFFLQTCVIVLCQRVYPIEQVQVLVWLQ